MSDDYIQNADISKDFYILFAYNTLPFSKEENFMSVAQIVKEVRKKTGVSTRKFSGMLGFKSKSHVWLVETGRRNPSVLMCKRLIKIAQEYNMILTMDMLLGEDDEFKSC
jgi:DNA-binding transcriptional regulator YiaG